MEIPSCVGETSWVDEQSHAFCPPTRAQQSVKRASVTYVPRESPVMLHVVTGGAGFVGVNLVDRLLTRGNRVIALDNCTRGRAAYLQRFAVHPDFHFITVDCADLGAFRSAISSFVSRGEIGEVWHLAANSDIPAGIADPTIDCRGTFMTTFNT